VRLSPETCRVKPLRRIKTQLLHLVGLISLTLVILVMGVVGIGGELVEEDERKAQKQQ